MKKKNELSVYMDGLYSSKLDHIYIYIMYAF